MGFVWVIRVIGIYGGSWGLLALLRVISVSGFIGVLGVYWGNWVYLH